MRVGAKRRLRKAFRDGEELELGGAAVDGEFLAGLLRDPSGGRLHLRDARIIGTLDLIGVRLETPLHIHDCVFEQEPRLDHADLASVNFDGCTMPGFEGDGVRVSGDLSIRGATINGVVWLQPARVGGTVELNDSTVAGTVYLERAEIGGLQLRDAVVVAGLRMQDARVAGNVNLDRARIGPDTQSDTAVLAAGVIAGGSLTMVSLDADGPVNLVGVQAGGAITVQATVVRARSRDFSLLLIEARASLLTLRPAPGSDGLVSLRDARVGRLVDDPVNWPVACRVELDGLTYERLSRRSEDVAQWSARQRLAWMARCGAGFAPGPYDQLAAALARDGREQEARQVRVARERRRYRAMGWAGTVWGAVQDAGLGFGYRPGRALAWLLLVVAASTGWFTWSGPLRAVKADEAPAWDPFLYSVDVLVPLLDLGHDKAFDPAGADKAVMLAVMAAGWILATTVVAGAGRTLGRGGV